MTTSHGDKKASEKTVIADSSTALIRELMAENFIKCIDAIENENLEKLNEILESNFDVINQVDEQGLGLIHVSLLLDKPNIFNLIVKHLTEKNKLNLLIQPNEDGLTPLHFATSFASFSMLSLLIEKIDPKFLHDAVTRRDCHNLNCLHLAKRYEMSSDADWNAMADSIAIELNLSVDSRNALKKKDFEFLKQEIHSTRKSISELMLRIKLTQREKRFNCLLPFALENQCGYFNEVSKIDKLLERYANEIKEDKSGELKLNLEHAVKVMNQLGDIAKFTDAHPEMNLKYQSQERKQISEKGELMRAEIANLEIPDEIQGTLKHKHLLLDYNFQKMKEYGIGTCGDLVVVGMKISNDIDPTKRCELYNLVYGDHQFMVLQRSGDPTNVNDFNKWGKNTVICDFLTKQIYMAHEIPERMQFWERINNVGIIMGYAHPELYEVRRAENTVLHLEENQQKKLEPSVTNSFSARHI